MSLWEDDLFIFAPSMEYAMRLAEGKAVGTAPEVDLVFLDKDQTIQALSNADAHQHRRKQGVTVGKRQLDAAQKEALPQILKHLEQYAKGNLSAKEFKKAMTRTMKVAWRKVFLAGVRASGTPSSGQQAKHAKWTVELSPADEKWFKGAVAHEMRFLNKFVKAVVEDTWVMPLERRATMYIDALASFYESARVIGLPALVSIQWKLGKDDDAVCPSCRYLAAHSPYTKQLLPTTPRSGLTICLTNCRDKLLIRKATPAQIQAIEDKHRYKRSGHIKNLREIKRLGQMPPRLLKSLPPGSKT